MLETSVVVVIAFAYLGLLFAIAFFADRRAAAGRSLIRNPVVYTLSIGVYCTSWTFYGAVGSAARNGVEFATIYLGPTLVFIGWWYLLRKMVRISKEQRITSIADFISSRYGKSTPLSVMVSLIAVAGTTPYISLQLKAVAVSFNVVIGLEGAHGVATADPTSLVTDTAFWVAVGMAAFVILFGTRQHDADEHHEGVVAAIAFESLVKLFALLAVGVLVALPLIGDIDLLAAAATDPRINELLYRAPHDDWPRWLSLMVLSMTAVLCLPRQFQITVVENVDERHLFTASWLFPLYLFAVSLFVLPIALAGLVTLPNGADPDFYVLTVPMAAGKETLALAAFVGGLSSATSMVIVAAIALSTMVCNHLVMPALLQLPWLRLTERGDLTGLLLFIRRISIVIVLLLGFAYYRLAGVSGALAEIGLVSFAAVAQFLPLILGGLFWKGGTQSGATAGLVSGFALWAYTLLLPSFARTGWLDPSFVVNGPWGIALLAPESLFGLNGWDNLAHALFWSLLTNITCYIAGSMLSREDALGSIQAALFVDVFRRSGGSEPRVWRRSASVEDLYALVQRFLGRERAYRAFRDYSRAQGKGAAGQLPEADTHLVSFVERLLAGSIGAASARVMVSTVAKGENVSLDEVMAILEETHQAIEYSHRLEQQSRELATTAEALRQANERLKELDKLKDDFLSSVSHELRTPMTSIRSFSEILVDNPDLKAEKARRYLSIIAAETQRLTRLLDEILDLARLEQGHGEWLMDEIDVAQVLEDAVAATSGHAQDRKVTLDRTILPALRPVHADRDRLMQVFVNLLSNGIKFSDTEKGEVMVRGAPKGRGYLVTITDNGPGVREKDRLRIFEKFVRVGRGAGEGPGGSGLGLPISRHIVEHFGGRIWVRSNPGGGATFCVLLPTSVKEPALLTPAQG